MTCGRYLERALDKGLEVAKKFNGEQCTGDRPAGAEGGSLRKVKQGLGGALRPSNGIRGGLDSGPGVVPADKGGQMGLLQSLC